MPRRLRLEEHLAFYAAFHQSDRNKLAHALGVPGVIWSAIAVLAWIRWGDGPSASLLNGGMLGALGLTAAMLRMDAAGAAMVGAPSILVAAAAPLVVTRWADVAAAAAVHLVSWYIPVKLGHEVWEPLLVVGDATEDSNLYFRRGYNYGLNLGFEPSLADCWFQFCVAPLSVAMDLSWQLGLRLSLRDRVHEERDQIVDRLRRGLTPFQPAAPIERQRCRRPTGCGGSDRHGGLPRPRRALALALLPLRWATSLVAGRERAR